MESKQLSGSAETRTNIVQAISLGTEGHRCEARSSNFRAGVAEQLISEGKDLLNTLR